MARKAKKKVHCEESRKLESYYIYKLMIGQRGSILHFSHFTINAKHTAKQTSSMECQYMVSKETI